MSATYIRKNHLSGEKDYVWIYKQKFMIRLPYNPPEEVDGWSVNIGQNNNTKLIRLRIMDSDLQSFLLQFPYEGLWDEEEEESEDEDGYYQSEEEDDEPTEGEIIYEEHDEAQH